MQTAHVRACTDAGARASDAESPRRLRPQLDPTVAIPLRGPVGLRFRDDAVEEQFRATYQLKTLSAMRFALAAGIGMYAIFGALDARIIAAADLPRVYVIRYAVVIPILSLGLALLFRPIGRRNSIYITATAGAVAGVGLVGIVGSAAAGSKLAYYAGFLLIDMFVYTVMQLPFICATVVGWGVMLLYLADALIRGVPADTLVWQGFFLTSGNLAGMVGAWFIERLRRRDFAAQLVLARDRATLVHLADELEKIAQRDPLTGLFNRRHLEAQLHRMVQLHKRYGVESSVILVDLDDFKDINDTYGHPVGDTVLVACAAAIRDCIRATDMAFRYGGDEFLVLAPETAIEVAVPIGERLRQAFSKLDVPDLNGALAVSCSVGISTVRTEDGVATDVLSAVDAALYRAKHAGKARVIVDDRGG